MKIITALLVLELVTSFYTTASSVCVCNRDTDLHLQVFDSTQAPIGHLDPNDCAAYSKKSHIDQGWLSIEFNQETAYIKEDESIVFEECTRTSSEDEPTEMPITYTMVASTMAPSVPTTQQTSSGNKPLSSDLLGHVKQCPSYVVQGANSNGYVLTQYHHACYEVCQDRVSWTHAHMLCTERGGDLVSIHNEKENTYLVQVLQQVYNHTVWIGLQDRAHEEHFKWTTGEKVTYTNWKQHHRMSANHEHEDCVMMRPGGTWDDIECGGNHPGSEANHTTHAYVCEYKTHNNGAFIVG